jgi:plastocyanin
MLRRAIGIIAAGSVVAAMIACGGSSSDTTGPTPVFTSVIITPTSPAVSPGNTIPMTATAKDQNGNTMSGLPAATWTSSDETKATIDPASGVATGVANGSTTITATIVSGSITHSGTAQLVVGTPPPTGSVTATASLSFNPHTVTIGRSGGTGSITWTFESVAHTVKFDNEPGGANVADIPLTNSASIARNFTVAGTYNYHCTVHSNMSGVIIVQ